MSTQDSSMLDDIQLDDEDTVEMVEMVGGVTGGGVKGRLDIEDDELDTTSLQGLVGVHEAVLMSIDKCGQSATVD